MAMPSICRICLVDDVQLRVIVDTYLQEIYESLTSMPFVTEDRRPVIVCDSCRAKLEICYQLKRSCIRSENLFSQLLTCIVQVQLQKLGPGVQLSGDDVVKSAPARCCNDEVKHEDSEVSEQDSSAGDYTQPSDLEEHSSDLAAKEEQSETTHGTPDAFNSDITNPIIHEEASSGHMKYKEAAGSSATISTDKLEALGSVGTSAAINNFKERKQRTAKATSKRKNKNKDDSCGRSIKKPFQCNVCPLSFRFVSHFDRHVRSHTVEKPYKCDYCQKCFSVKDNLENHIRIHAGTKPFQCNECKKSFSDSSQLNKHSCVHSGLKPYQCKVCQKEFRMRGHLIIHERLHTDEKPYKCNICAEAFRTRYNLTTHYRIHTGERPYSVQLKEYFAKKSLLGQHNSRVHLPKKVPKDPMPVYLLKRVSDGELHAAPMKSVNKIEIIIGDMPVSKSPE